MNLKNRRSLFLARALSRAPQGPLFSPEDPPGGGGGGAPTPEPAKTFTQADIDKVLGQRLAEERKKFADYDDVKARAKAQEEANAELAKRLEELELKGKSAEEREKIAAEKAAKRLEAERNEITAKMTAAEQRAEAAEKKYRTKIVDDALGGGLDKAKVLSSARASAVKLFRDEAKIELDDDGKVVSIEYGGMSHKSVDDAAAAFLKDNDYLAAGDVPRGGGTKSPNGGGSALPVDASAIDQIAAGLAARK
jgi:hypothetical protein